MNDVEDKATSLDPIAGKTKQLVAEVIGDGNLNEEGKEQTRDRDDQASENKRGTTGQSVNQKKLELKVRPHG